MCLGRVDYGIESGFNMELHTLKNMDGILKYCIHYM